MAVLRGALTLAERDGRMRAEMRARINLSAWGSWEDPLEAFAVASEGIDRGLARGYTPWAMTMAGNACEMALVLGEWDWIGETVRRLGLDESVTPWEQAPVASLARVEAYRGHDTQAATLFEHMLEIIVPTQDPQLQLALAATEAEIAFARGDLDAAARAARRALDLGAASGLGDDPQFGMIALERRDLASSRLAAGFARGGRVRDALLDAFKGGGDALDGDVGGLAIMDEAISRLEAIGVRFGVAQLWRLRAMLAPDDGGAPAAAERAMAVFRELGAVMLFRGLERFARSEPSPDAVEGEPAPLG